MELSPPRVPTPSADPVRTEGEPLPPLAAEDSTVVDALAAVLATDAEAVSRPGQLRQRLEHELGPDQAARLRPLVHQVVVAAEENLPGYLTRITPLTGQSLRQLSGELAAARGWNQATAQRVTQVWAHALGFGAVSGDWPRAEPMPMPAPVPVADGRTALPASSDPLAPWPPTRRRFSAKHPSASSGEPVAAAAWGYAGMPLQAYVAAVAAIVAVIVLALVLLEVLVGGLLIVPVVLLLRWAQRPGVLLATTHGLEFVPYSALAGKPKGEGAFAAPWHEVAVDEASFSVLRLSGRRVRLGPANRGFAHAAATRAGGGV